MKKRLKFSFMPEGETDTIKLEFGHICGKADRESVAVCLPDYGGKTRNSVMTHGQVRDLIAFLTACEKRFATARSFHEMMKEIAE